MVPNRFAILLDGGFVKKALKAKLRRFPDAADIQALCTTLAASGPLTGQDLYRIFYYDCDPFTGSATNPLSGSTTNFQNTPAARLNTSLIQKLELAPNFAIRRGELICTGWKLGKAALRSLRANAARPLVASDLVPDLQQKGVDMRIGLDIASVALKRLVQAVVLVTGDSDMIPAMKLARREGLLVYLDTLRQPVRRDLRVHADIVL